MTKLIILLFILVSCGKAIQEKSSNESGRETLLSGVSEEILLDMKMFSNFEFLPLEGRIDTRGKFWTGSSWPLHLGAINFRWNSFYLESFNYQSPFSREVHSLTQEKLKSLSPSEKYDLYMGRYDYPLKYEVDAYARNGRENWEGLCHGWVGATMNHSEPAPRNLLNPDGILIPFGSSDIKALLTYAYSKVLIKDTDILGTRCEESRYEDDCRDELTPESFHVVITNKIGLRNQTVIGDMDPLNEVWNHPIVSYKSTIEKMMSAGTGKYAVISTELTYLDVTEKNSWNMQRPLYSFMTVKYELDIDHNGNIKKGKWLSRERPDFLWTLPKVDPFTGYLSGIKDLIK